MRNFKKNYLLEVCLQILFVTMAFVALNSCNDKISTEPEQNKAIKAEGSTLKAAQSGSFTVVTYNVAGLPQIMSSASNRDVYTPIIGDLLNEFDIIHVQEDFNYHADLYSTSEHAYRTATSGGVPFGDGLNTMSKYPFTDFQRISWNTCNGTDCLTPKGFTFMRIRMEEGVYIDFYNVHTNAGIEDADLAARRDNIMQLSDFVNTYSQGNAVIVMGDMNCRYTRSEDNIRTLITNNGLTDVWIQLERNGSFPAMGDDALVCSWPDFNDATCEVVDKIFYRSSPYITLTPTAYQLDDEDFVSPDGTEPLSDHPPLLASFDYSLNAGFKLSDLFGGPHGTPFNNINKLATSSTPVAFIVKGGTRIDNVGVTLPDGTSYYQLKNRGTGLMLDGMGRTENGSAVGQYANTVHPNAQWQLIDKGSGYFQLLNRGTNLVADGYGRTANGSDCAQYASYTNHYNSQWALQVYEGNYFQLQNRGTALFLDGMGRTANGSACGQWANTSHPNSQWQLVIASGINLSDGGTGGTEYDLTLSPTDYVNYVKMCSGQKDGHTRIFYIELKTNEGRVISAGSQTSDVKEFNIPSGWKLAGFYGNCGDEIDKLGLIYTQL